MFKWGLSAALLDHSGFSSLVEPLLSPQDSLFNHQWSKLNNTQVIMTLSNPSDNKIRPEQVHVLSVVWKNWMTDFRLDYLKRKSPPPLFFLPPPTLCCLCSLQRCLCPRCGCVPLLTRRNECFQGQTRQKRLNFTTWLNCPVMEKYC